MGVQTSKLILQLVDMVTAPARTVHGSLGRLKRAEQQHAREMTAMRGKMMDASGAAYVMARALMAPIRAATDFESAMADINKVVDFENMPGGLEKMGDDIVRLSQKIPMAATEMAKIVEAAGQAGMAGDELLQFAEMAAKVGVAFDVSAQEAGESLAKIKTALGLSVDETKDLADAINHLSNTSASSAPDLLNFMRRVGSVGKQYGFTKEQTLAFGSSMIAAGFQADVAATSFRNMGKALVRGESATKRQRGAFKTLGLDAKKVAKSMQKDAVGTTNAVIAKIRELPKEVQASLLSDLFGDEARAIAPLIENQKLLAGSLDEVASKAKFMNSSQKEFETRSKTTANAAILLRNKWDALSITIGSVLLPALNDLMSEIGPVIQAMAEWVKAHPEATENIIKLAVGIVGLQLALTASKYAFGIFRGGLLDVGITALKSAKGLGVLVSPFKAVGRAAIRAKRQVAAFAFASKLYGVKSASGMALSSLGKGFLGLLNPLRLVRGAFNLLRTAIMANPLGLILGGIALAGTWIYNNWSNLKHMFSEFGDAFMQAIEPIKPVLDPIKDSVSGLFDWVSKLVGPVDDVNDSFGQFGASVGKSVGEGLVAVVQFVEDLKKKFDEFIEWMKNIPSRIIAAIGKIDLSNIIKWPSFGMGGKSQSGNFYMPPPKPDGERAIGGPIVGGKTYLVGEDGPEFVTPQKSGYVHNNKDTMGMLGGVGGAGGSPVFDISFGDIILSGISNVEEIADQISDILAGRIKTKLAGLHADMEFENR